MSDADVCRRYHVSGHVQGVFYRASTRERARRLGLAGWVRNLDDGRVEAVARGPVEALSAFADWLAQGPDGAAVSAVTSEAADAQTPRPFEIR